MSKKYIPVNISNEGFCAKGIYLVNEDGRFDGYPVIDDALKKDIRPPFKLMLRTKVTLNGKYVERKKTYESKSNSTLSSLVKKITLEKDSFREEAITPKQVILEAKEDESFKTITLGDYWLNDYVPFKESTLNKKQSWKASTAKDMKSFYNAWIKDSILNNIKMISVKESDVEGLINRIRNAGKSLRTQKKTVDALAPMFKRFYKTYKINELNPAEIELGDLDNKREVIVSLDMTKRLYSAMENYPIQKYRDIFLWLRTGRRLNEVLSLEMNDVDIDKKLFHIIPDKNKAGKRTTFVLRPEMIDSLKNKTKLVHPSKKDTIMDSHTLRHHWVNILEAAKIKDNIHLHDIRHIIGTVLRDSGVNEELRALVLGHTRSGVTARYASANAELANDLFDFFLKKINGDIGAKAQWEGE